MWWARVWFLLILMATAALLAGAVTLPGFRDDAVAAADGRSAALEVDLLVAQLTERVRDQRRSVQQLAAAPHLKASLDMLDGELQPHVRQAQLNSTMRTLHQGQSGLGLTLVGPGPELWATTVADQGVVRQVVAARPTAQALTGGAPAGVVAGRFIIAVPVAGAGNKPRAALIATAPQPAFALVANHAKRGSKTFLVVKDGDRTHTNLDPSAQKTLLGAVPGKATEFTLSGRAYRARRFKAPHGLEIILAWPLPRAVGLADAGGLGGLVSRAVERPTLLVGLMTVALLLWLVGVVVGVLATRPSLRRLLIELDGLAAGPSLALIETTALPKWLRPIAQAANGAARGAQRIGQGLSAPRRPDRASAPPQEQEPSKAPPAAAKPTPASKPAPVPAKPAPVPAKPAPEPVSAASEPPSAASEPNSAASEPPSAASEPNSAASEPPSAASEPPSAASEPPSAASEPPSATSEPPPDASKRAALVLPPERLGDENPVVVSRRVLPHEAETSLTVSPEIAADEDAETQIASSPGANMNEEGLTSVQRDTGSVNAMNDELDGPDVASTSLFDTSLPSLDEEDEPDAEDTDSDIQLPGEPQAKPTGESLLDSLRYHSALEPEKRRPYSSGDTTQVKPVTLDLLAASRSEQERTAVTRVPQPPAPDLEVYFREVFDELVATKTACGESVDSLDYRRFRSKLQRTRLSLMERFKCQDVRFRVYVKNERAALKAAPVLHPGA